MSRKKPYSWVDAALNNGGYLKAPLFQYESGFSLFPIQDPQTKDVFWLEKIYMTYVNFYSTEYDRLEGKDNSIYDGHFPYKLYKIIKFSGRIVNKLSE